MVLRRAAPHIPLHFGMFDYCIMKAPLVFSYGRPKFSFTCKKDRVI